MKKMKKLLSLVLVLVLLAGFIPMKTFATGDDNVYISVSYDDKYIINNKDGGYIAYVPVSFSQLETIDLNEYGLEDYLYDEDGDGESDITALHLIIYAHENMYGGDFNEVTFSGSPGSSYFEGGVFGFDENLNYYLNGQYPLAGNGWGATSDQIVLEPGDFVDMAAFTSWDFYQDSAYGFHYFADEEGYITHNYTVDEGEDLTIKLIRGTKDYEYNSVLMDEPDYQVHYGKALYEEAGSVETDGSAQATITLPSSGTWYLWADGGYGSEFSASIVSAPGYAVVTVKEAAAEPEVPEVEEPAEAQDVSEVLNATMAKLAATVTEPVFGTSAGEWTVLSLARGGYYGKDNTYFTEYYDRIVETVNETAASVDMNGALHKNKSTENSRLIVALSSIGKDATSVGEWDLVEAYSANGFDWIKKQGMNGTIWALLALDSNDYETTDETLRQQCIDSIISLQHNDGGWALQANLDYASDPDVTGMALTALYPYRDQKAVAEACEEAFACLSEMQGEGGIYSSGGTATAESCAWVIVAASTWGINPDTDSRFIKNGYSVVDGLLAHYLEDSDTFEHIIGAGTNGMATDQSCYALVAYNRLNNEQPALFDFSDVTFEEATPDTDEMTASLTLPANVNSGAEFNATVSVNKWDNEAGYKLIDFIMTVPEGVAVTEVTPCEGLEGGAVSYNLDGEGKLRVVYFDAEENSDITVTGTDLFTITFVADASAAAELNFAIDGMSVKLTSDSTDENAMIVVNTEKANGTVNLVVGISFSASCLYTGDDVDLIPSTKKAVAVAVTGIKAGTKLTYNDGINTVEFLYSSEITEKTGVATYAAIVDAAIEMNNFVAEAYYSLPGGNAESLAFGDSSGDGEVNAQDALNTVNAWLRKSEVLEEDGTLSDINILVMNVNGDSRVNTFDALGVVEAFVNNSEYGVVTKAAAIQ